MKKVFRPKRCPIRCFWPMRPFIFKLTLHPDLCVRSHYMESRVRQAIVDQHPKCLESPEKCQQRKLQDQRLSHPLDCMCQRHIQEKPLVMCQMHPVWVLIQYPDRCKIMGIGTYRVPKIMKSLIHKSRVF